VKRIGQKLEIGLEVVLIRVCTRINSLLYPFELCNYINRWLLVALRRVLEVGERALELDRVVPVFYESGGDRRVERYTG
jgi:hypothetical protein